MRKKMLAYDDKLRRETDLSTLLRLLSTVNQCRIAKSLRVADLHGIGEACQLISWREDDKHCIRNKHGYCSRYKPDAGKKNTTGAKLDFEQLGRLVDYPEDNEHATLLEKNLENCLKSLKSIAEKIAFIFIAEQNNLTPAHQVDLVSQNIDFSSTQSEAHPDEKLDLEVLGSFAYDYQCVNRLKAHLETFINGDYPKLDLTDRINRYEIAYLFSLAGETAKEISAYVKPDKSAVKSLFGKLGKYRDEIKTNSAIVYGNDTTRLDNMRMQFNRIIPKLLAILDTLLNHLAAHYLNTGDLTNFKQAATEAALMRAHQTDITACIEALVIGKTDIDKKLETLRRMLEGITAADQLKADASKTGKKERHYQDIEGFRQKVPRLESDIVVIKQKLESLPTMQAAQSGASIQFLTSAFETKKAKQLVNLCQFLSAEIVDNSDFTDAEKSLLRLLKKRYDDAHPGKGTASDESKLALFKKWLPEYKKNIDAALLKLFDITADEQTDYLNQFEDFSKHAPDLSVRNLKIMLSKLQPQLKTAKTELASTEKLYAQYQTLAEASVPHEHQHQHHYSLPESYRLVTKATHEIAFLQELFVLLEEAFLANDAKRWDKLIMAEKMAFGFLGQLYKDMMQEKHQPHLGPYFLAGAVLKQDIFAAIHVRHKQISHNMHQADVGVIQTTLSHQILPWLAELKHMQALMSGQHTLEAVSHLTPFDARLDILVESLNETEQEIYIHYLRIVALNRFLLTEQALNEYATLVALEGVMPELVLELHWQASLAYRNQGKFDCCIEVLLKAMDAAKQIQDEATQRLKSNGLWLDASIAYIELNNYSEALTLLAEITDNPDLPLQLIAAKFLQGSIYLIQDKNELALAHLELVLVQHYQTMLVSNAAFLPAFLSNLSLAYLENTHLDAFQETFTYLQSVMRTHGIHFKSDMGQRAFYFDIMQAPLLKYELLTALCNVESTSQTIVSIQKKLALTTTQRANFSYFDTKTELTTLQDLLEIFQDVELSPLLDDKLILQHEIIEEMRREIMLFHLLGFKEANSLVGNSTTSTHRNACQAQLSTLAKWLIAKLQAASKEALIANKHHDAQKYAIQSLLCMGLVAYLFEESKTIVADAKRATSNPPRPINEITAFLLEQWRNEKGSRVDLKLVHAFLVIKLGTLNLTPLFRNIAGEYRNAIETQNTATLDALIVDRQAHLQAVKEAQDTLDAPESMVTPAPLPAATPTPPTKPINFGGLRHGFLLPPKNSTQKKLSTPPNAGENRGLKGSCRT